MPNKMLYPLIIKKSQKTTSPIPNITRDILSEIFSYLPSKSLFTMRSVCHFFLSTANPLYWKRKFILHFPQLVEFTEKKENCDWQYEFINRCYYEYGFDELVTNKLFFNLKEENFQILKTLNFLLKHLDEVDKYEFTPLIWAQKKRNEQILKHLYEICVKKCKDIFQMPQDNWYYSPVNWAIRCHLSPSTIRKLIKLYDETDTFKLFMSAVESGHLKYVDYLLNNENDKNKIIAEFNLESNDLHDFEKMLSYGHVEIVRSILKSGINLDFIGGELHLASLVGDLNFFKDTVKKGFNINAINKDGLSPIRIAYHYHHLSIFCYLLEKNATLWDSDEIVLKEAIITRRFDIIYILLMKWVEFKSTGYTINQLLLSVINSRHANLINLLIANGADFKNGQIFKAVIDQKNYSMIKFLLKNGVDINQPIDGKTPLEIAVLNRDLDTVQYLLKKGALNKSGLDGMTPLALAEKNQYMQIAEIIREAETIQQDVQDLEMREPIPKKMKLN